MAAVRSVSVYCFPRIPFSGMIGDKTKLQALNYKVAALMQPLYRDAPDTVVCVDDRTYGLRVK